MNRTEKIARIIDEHPMRRGDGALVAKCGGWQCSWNGFDHNHHIASEINKMLGAEVVDTRIDPPGYPD